MAEFTLRDADKKKLKALLGIRCDTHGEYPTLATADGKLVFQTCCDDLDKRLSTANSRASSE